MVYSKHVKIAVNRAIAELKAINQRRDNIDNLRLLKSAYKEAVKAIRVLESGMS